MVLIIIAFVFVHFIIMIRFFFLENNFCRFFCSDDKQNSKPFSCKQTHSRQMYCGNLIVSLIILYFCRDIFRIHVYFTTEIKILWRGVAFAIFHLVLFDQIHFIAGQNVSLTFENEVKIVWSDTVHTRCWRNPPHMIQV